MRYFLRRFLVGLALALAMMGVRYLLHTVQI